MGKGYYFYLLSPCYPLHGDNVLYFLPNSNSTYLSLPSTINLNTLISFTNSKTPIKLPTFSYFLTIHSFTVLYIKGSPHGIYQRATLRTLINLATNTF